MYLRELHSLKKIKNPILKKFKFGDREPDPRSPINFVEKIQSSKMMKGWIL